MPALTLIEPQRLGRGLSQMCAVQSYSTTFSLTEAPISESGNWSKRSTSRTTVSTSGGIAFGTQTAHAAPPFDDSYAFLNGVWSANTEATATVFKGTTTGIQEIEFLFRLTDSASNGIVTCYEMNIAQDGSYANCYAWTGDDSSLANFTQLTTASVSGGIGNGYKFKGRCQG